MPNESPHRRPDERQRILLVTGMLGAGKTTALRELEDLGWEVIDNFPVRLLDRLIGPEDPGREQREDHEGKNDDQAEQSQLALEERLEDRHCREYPLSRKRRSISCGVTRSTD